MAGSMEYFDYVSDAGTFHTLKMDESNGRVVGNTLTTAATPSLPQGLLPRYALYRTASGKRQRKIFVGDPAKMKADGTGIPLTFTVTADGGAVSDTTENLFSLSFLSGERQKVINFAGDSGLTDGTP